MATSTSESAYQIKVTLMGSKPPIWRRFSVPSHVSLDRLHDVIQIVMGWHDTHLHAFEIEGQRYTEDPEDPTEEGIAEEGFRLCDLVKDPSAKFTYEYDFGDGWWHELEVEKIGPLRSSDEACVTFLDGRRRCPPEDVGGIDGYAEFITALADPEHPEHDDYLVWCGGQFDPDELVGERVQLELLKYLRWSRDRPLSWAL